MVNHFLLQDNPSICSSLVDLPPSLVAVLTSQNVLPQTLAVVLSCKKSRVLLGWSGLPSQPARSSQHVEGGILVSGTSLGAEREVIEVSPVLLSHLPSEFRTYSPISVQFKRHLQALSRVTVTSLTSADWEVIGRNAQLAENLMLQQVRVAVPDQIVCIWLEGISVSLKISSVESASEGLLGSETEVLVAPPVGYKEGLRELSPAPKSPRKHFSVVLRQLPVANLDAKIVAKFISEASGNHTAFVSFNTFEAFTSNGWTSAKYEKHIFPELLGAKTQLDSGIQNSVELCFRLIPDHSLPQKHVVFVPLIPDCGDWRTCTLKGTSSTTPCDSSTIEVPAPLHDNSYPPFTATPIYTILINQLLSIFTIHSPYPYGVDALRMGGILLQGSDLSCKKIVTSRICSSLSKSHLIATISVPCGALASLSLPKLVQHLSRFVLASNTMQPCLLIFEDLDKLSSAENAADESNTESDTKASIVKSAISSCQRGVVWLATCKSEINKSLLGNKCFILTEKLPQPSYEQRLLCLTSLTPSLPMEEIARLTDGFEMSELFQLVQHAKIRSIETCNLGQERDLVESDLLLAVKSFEAEFSRGFDTSSAASISWTDIGGLVFAKNYLRETIELPAKFPLIFGNAPLRLRSGILLYGPPGCGKTMLASAVAKECGLKFVAVKGPELLGKYIGSSEAAVRDLFKKARANKPCVLFFDEFDSMAPKRGHDSTGVTDRVVNQLLTELDGAQGLEGVYVLAASNRPDLLDPALIRPGRLDKSIMCDMPSREDRVCILKAVAATMSIQESRCFEYIADKTEGYSGADIKALLYDAYMSAINQEISKANLVHEIPSNSGTSRIRRSHMFGRKDHAAHGSAKEETESPKDPVVKFGSQSENQSASERTGPQVLEHHLMNSLEISRPSTSITEQHRLATIYRHFSTDRQGDFPSGIASKAIASRATLM